MKHDQVLGIKPKFISACRAKKISKWDFAPLTIGFIVPLVKVVNFIKESFKEVFCILFIYKRDELSAK